MEEANAYMLVYIRDSSQDEVLAPVTINDIPHHLSERIENEKVAMEVVEKERAEQHLYMTVYIVTDAGFLMNTSIGFIDHLAQNEWCPYQETRWPRDMTVGNFLQQYTEANNINIDDTRVWIIVPQSKTAKDPLRPAYLISPQYYTICNSTLLYTHKSKMYS